MSRDCLLERLADKLRALGVVDPVAGDEAAVVVDQNQRKGRGAVDMLVHEVEMPQVIRSYRFEPFVMGLSLDLRRAVARLFHHAARRVH